MKKMLIWHSNIIWQLVRATVHVLYKHISSFFSLCHVSTAMRRCWTGNLVILSSITHYTKVIKLIWLPVTKALNALYPAKTRRFKYVFYFMEVSESLFVPTITVLIHIFFFLVTTKIKGRVPSARNNYISFIKIWRS